MWKCDPVLADVNGDGVLDLAALPRLGNGPRVWLGHADGTWSPSSSGLDPGQRSCGGGLAVGDVDHDGAMDLVVGDHCQGIFVYLGNGRGGWTLAAESLHPPAAIPGDASYRVYAGTEDLALGDINEDGNLDIVASASDEGGINVYLGTGSGDTWTWTEVALQHKGWANRVMLADVNADDHLDVVASLGAGPRVWRGDGRAGFAEQSVGLPMPMIKGLYRGLAVGDVDHDGRVDLAVANWVDGPEVYLQQADGRWKKQPDVFPKMRGGAVGLDLGDLDGDGHLDMVVTGRLDRNAGYVRGVFALRGDGHGHWLYDDATGLPTAGLAACDGVTIAEQHGNHLIAVASGLIVETVPKGPAGPALDPHVLVWCVDNASP